MIQRFYTCILYKVTASNIGALDTQKGISKHMQCQNLRYQKIIVLRLNNTKKIFTVYSQKPYILPISSTISGAKRDKLSPYVTEEPKIKDEVIHLNRLSWCSEISRNGSCCSEGRKRGLDFALGSCPFTKFRKSQLKLLTITSASCDENRFPDLQTCYRTTICCFKIKK